MAEQILSTIKDDDPLSILFENEIRNGSPLRKRQEVENAVGASQDAVSKAEITIDPVLKENGSETGSDDDSDESFHSNGNEIWRDANYWKLPENVRAAVDIANAKQFHTPFWHKLNAMNDKLFVYKSVFYTKMPAHEQVFW